MELKKGELKVFYKLADDYVDQERKLDGAIEKVLKSFGFARWASGYDITTGVRDLAFDKKEVNHEENF